MKCGKKETEIWRLSTSVDKKKQVSAIFSSLKGQAREAIAGLDINKLSCDQEIENLIEKLDKPYVKDSQYSAYDGYEQFQKFSRPK